MFARGIANVVAHCAVRRIRSVSKCPMDALVFFGRVATGIGCHADLIVPGRHLLGQVDDDWPVLLYPGSLNIRVLHFPTAFREHGLTEDVEALDSGQFAPAFEIPRDLLRNNKLGPSRGMARRGDAQVWRARIDSGQGVALECWVLRRFGSKVGSQLELVAGSRLRDAGLLDDQLVSVVIYGHWRQSEPTIS